MVYKPVLYQNVAESEGTIMMWGYGFGWGWFMMAFGGVLWIALLVILVWALIRWLERKARVSGPSGSASPSALEILRQRYARGEIDATTFEQMRERLQATEHVPDASQEVPESSRRNF
jgi:putative membrane protein